MRVRERREHERREERARELALSVTTLAALSRWSFHCSRGDHDLRRENPKERERERASKMRLRGIAAG